MNDGDAAARLEAEACAQGPGRLAVAAWDAVALSRLWNAGPSSCGGAGRCGREAGRLLLLLRRELCDRVLRRGERRGGRVEAVGPVGRRSRVLGRTCCVEYHGWDRLRSRVLGLFARLCFEMGGRVREGWSRLAGRIWDGALPWEWLGDRSQRCGWSLCRCR